MESKWSTWPFRFYAFDTDFEWWYDDELVHEPEPEPRKQIEWMGRSWDV